MSARSEMMIIRLKSVAAAVVLLLFVTACGQKGPLYLPGNPSQVQTDIPRQQSPNPQAANEEEDAEDDEHR